MQTGGADNIKGQNVMKCENCGAQYEENEKCPYCGYENVKEAQKKYKIKEKKLIDERKKLLKLPQLITGKAGKIFGVMVLAGIVIIMVIAVGMSYYNQNKDERNIKSEAENIAAMERLLNDKDYKGLSDYCKSLGYVYVSYDKFEEVSNVYNYYERLSESLKSDDNFKGELPDEILRDNLEWSVEMLYALNKCGMEYISDRKRMANEDNIREIVENGKREFMTSYGFDESAVKQVLELEDSSGKEAFYELADRLLSEK